MNGHTGAVRALVDSKANLEARDEVTMWPVQPGAICLLVVVMMMQLMLGKWHGAQLGHAGKG